VFDSHVVNNNYLTHIFAIES